MSRRNPAASYLGDAILDQDDEDGARKGGEGEENLGFLTSFQWIPQGFINPSSLHANAGIFADAQQQKDHLAQRMGLSQDQLRQLDDEQRQNEDVALGADGDNTNRNGNDDDDDNNNDNQKQNSSKKAQKPKPKNRAFGIDDDDYFITGGADNILQELESDDESEIDDTTIRPTDLVFVVARAGDEPSLEVTIYDEPRDNIYIHHDAQLVAPPLCVEWMYNTEHRTSLAAVGTMHPYIEIWNLDHSDAVDPAAVLGGCKNPSDNYLRTTFKKGTGRPSKIAKEKGLIRDDSHTDAVTSLKWNAGVAPSILASGSADCVVKVWDLEALACLGTVQHPIAKNSNSNNSSSGYRVQGLDWHPSDPNVLLAACGPSLDVLDCRSPDAAVCSWRCDTAQQQKHSSDDAIEKAMYVHVDANYVLASTSNSGSIALFDVRKGSESAPAWVLGPGLHGGEVTFAVSKHAPLLATGGKHDGIALWQFNEDSFAAEAPRRMCHRKLKVGQCFSLQFHPNSPEVLGACGTGGLPLVYTIANDVRLGQKMLKGESIDADLEELDQEQKRLSQKKKKYRHPPKMKASDYRKQQQNQ